MADVMIEAQDLGKTYGTVPALQGATFQVKRGEVLGFLGPNGAGKTTTMKILTCFIAPTTGTARVNGCDIFDDPMGVRSAIGYLPESTPLYTEMLVAEYLEWVARMRHLDGDTAQKRIKKVVEETGLGEVYGKEIRALSKGYRQRVGLAQSLIHEPPILILDEPMSGLDPNQAVEIRDLIKAIGKERTVILSTHNLAEVQVACDRVLIIARGKIVADDTPTHLKETAGKARFHVSVLGASGDEAKARQAFERIEGVSKVSTRNSDGEIHFELVPANGQDLRPMIFKAAVAQNLTLVELRREDQNLEGVFRELTLGGGTEVDAKGGPKNA